MYNSDYCDRQILYIFTKELGSSTYVFGFVEPITGYPTSQIHRRVSYDLMCEGPIEEPKDNILYEVTDHMFSWPQSTRDCLPVCYVVYKDGKELHYIGEQPWEYFYENLTHMEPWDAMVMTLL